MQGSQGGLVASLSMPMGRNMPHSVFKFLLLGLLTTTTTTTAAVPEDWAAGVRRHDLLYVGDEGAQLPPVLGNGVVGWQVDAPFLFLSGVNTRDNEGSVRRAHIPAQLSIRPQAGGNATSTVFLGEALDVRSGSFVRRRRFTSSSSVTVEQRWYAHRAFRSVLAMELKVTTSVTLTTPFELKLVDTAANQDQERDVVFTDLSPLYPDLRVWRGKVQAPETNKSTAEQDPVAVILVSTPVPSSLSITGNQTWHFVSAVRTSVGDPMGKYGKDPLQGTLLDHKMAQMMAPSQELFGLHRDNWKEWWNGVGIEVASTDAWLPAAVNASLHALNSAAREDWPFGLARGGLTEDHGGHTFWDAEMYLLPSLLLFNPAWARGLLEYRMDRLAAALARARTLGFSEGALFPWESAATGEEVTPADGMFVDGKGVHVSGAVSWVVWQYWLATNDRGWLEKVGFPLLRAVADFWVARAEVEEEGKAAHIRGVIPPDARAGVVDNSVYINVLARQALRYAARAAKILLPASGQQQEVEVQGATAAVMARYPAQDSVEAWERLANQLVVPFDASRGIHLEYEGYMYGQSIQQADAVLLGYPLGYFNDSTQAVRKLDFLYYKDKVLADGEGGKGAMTWGLHTVNALDLGLTEEAQAAFVSSYRPYCQPPFGIWTERKDSPTHFLPAAGGFLHALVYGYGGLR